MRFAGHTALVTGAADGIGQAIVAGILSEGAVVTVPDRNSSGFTDLTRFVTGQVWTIGGGRLAQLSLP